MITNVYDVRFSLFILIDILGLCLCSFILKRFIHNFPNKLIPLFNIILSYITTTLYLYHKTEGWPMHFLVVMGLLDGLAATGLHQLFKQTRIYLTLRYYLRKMTK